MTADLNAQQRRDEWKLLAEAATPGPWECESIDRGVWSLGLGGYVIDSWIRPVDREFIAASRTAVPALIAEVEALTAERDALRAAFAATVRWAADRAYNNLLAADVPATFARALSGKDGS